MLKMIWQKKALILFLVVLVALLPSALTRPAQMTTKAVLTEITIDHQSGEYVLTGEMIDLNAPADAESNTTTVTASAPSAAECINKIATEQGKQVSFAHCKYIVLGEGLADEDVTGLLRYFLYRTELNNSCQISWKQKGDRTTIEQFFKDYLRAHSASVVANGAFECAVFRDGKHAFDLDETQTDALNFLLGKKIKRRLVHENEVLHISRNSCKFKTSNGITTVTIKIRAQLESNPLATRAQLDAIEVALQDKLREDVRDTLDVLYPRADIFDLKMNNPMFVIKIDISVNC